jgi:hypothetical protein
VFTQTLVGTGCSSYATGAYTYTTCFPAAGTTAGSVRQYAPAALFKPATNVYLGRNMAWQSAYGSQQGGFYALSNGDNCGSGGAPRSGRLYMKCGTGKSLTVYEPSICWYNMTWTSAAGCIGSPGLVKNNAASAYCLSATPGATAVTQPCNGAAGSQLMVMRADSSLFNPASGLCLDVTGGTYTAFATLRLNACNGAPSQQFKPPGSYPGTYTSGLGAYCMTANATATVGTPVVLSSCGTNSNWVFSA